MIYEAIGVLEVSSIANGYNCEDAMLKAAEVELILARTICSGKFIIIIAGNIAAVNSSIEAGKAVSARAAGMSSCPVRKATVTRLLRVRGRMEISGLNSKTAEVRRLLPGLKVGEGFTRHPFDLEFGVRTSGLVAGRHLKSGHRHDRYATAYYGVAPSVFRALVARWRRICCSRVCRARRRAGRPRASLEIPTKRPGICR